MKLKLRRKRLGIESKPLPKYENGKEIEYDVKEVAVESYESQQLKTQDGKYTITNKRTPEKVNLTGQKTWEDDNDKDGLRPKEIQVRLLANGKDTGKVATASAATGWKYSFEQLPNMKQVRNHLYGGRSCGTRRIHSEGRRHEYHESSYARETTNPPVHQKSQRRPFSINRQSQFILGIILQVVHIRWSCLLVKEEGNSIIRQNNESPLEKSSGLFRFFGNGYG